MFDAYKKILSAFFSNNHRLILIWVAIIVDQWTKYLFYDYHLFSSWSLFTPVFNTGIIGWYMMHKAIVIVVSIIALIMFYNLYLMRQISKMPYVLLVSGTIWNLLDRLILWWVRDFVDFQFFPVFNMADVYLTCAIIILSYQQRIWYQNRKKTNKSI
jgi:signal peptidase II